MNPKFAITAALVASLLPHQASSQAPSVQIQRTGNDIHLIFPTDPKSYYIVRSGSDLEALNQPIDMALGTGLIETLIDAGILATRPERGFYRLEKVLRNQPKDTDGDGINDVLELQHTFLDPLNPADAELDFDNDGFSNRSELLEHLTAPGEVNPQLTPPRLHGLSYQAAKTALEIAGLNVGNITVIPSVQNPASSVLAPVFTASNILPSGGTLNLTISLPSDPDRFIDQRNLTTGFDGSEENSLAYYQAVDPNNQRMTLEAWKTANAFGQPGGEETFAAYFNEADLGFGRRMFMRRDSQRIAFYVVNYANANEAAEGTPTDIATVAMEYSPHPVNGGDPYVKFFTFNGNHNDPSKRASPWSAPDSRLTKIDLDGRGAKFQPGMCMTCHGGDPRQSNPDGSYPDLGRTGARFIPFDIDSFTYPTLPGFDRSDQEAAFKELNEGVLASIPLEKKFTSSVSVAIPDSQSDGIDIVLPVSGIDGNIADLDFSFDGMGPPNTNQFDQGNGLNHSFVGDLVVKLTSPAGTKVTLIDRIGVPALGSLGVSANNFSQLRLSDEVSNPIEDAVNDQAPFQGSWMPNNPLAAFDGENPNGNWTLNVSDQIGGDTGNVNQWSLRITPSHASPLQHPDAVVDLIHGWYGGPLLPGAFNPNFAPAAWLSPSSVAAGGDELYHGVIAKSCRACHIMQTDRKSALAFATYDQFAAFRNQVRHEVFHKGRMPMAKRTFDKFWNSVDASQAELLANWITGPSRYSYTGPSVLIPEFGQGTAVIPFTVSGIAGPITDLDFSFDGSGPGSDIPGDSNNGLSHEDVSNLLITLTSPAGTSVVLADRIGGGKGVNFFHTRFDDQVGTTFAGILPTQTPYVGAWKPSNPLAAFNDEDPNGPWELRIQDQAPGDTGSLHQFSLHFNSLGATTGPGKPLAVIAAPAAAVNQQTVLLDGNQSLFAGGSFAWAFRSTPSGSNAVIANANTSNASFVIDREGIYTVTLTVANDFGSHVATHSIVVSNKAPQVSATVDSTVLYPAAAKIVYTVSDDGFPLVPGALSLSWERLSGPGAVTFANPTEADITVTFGLPGTYELRLTASDGLLDDSVTMTVVADAALAVISNAGNPPDPVTGKGVVGYEYRIGKFEVTNAQYAAFLNAVATDADPFNLYDPEMGASTFGGILKSEEVGNVFYSTKPGHALRPVAYVSFFDTIRYVNWLHNGAQAGSAIQDGAYTLLGTTTIPSNGQTVTRNPGARFWIPSDNEWYKAAYHQPAGEGGDLDDYWAYATRSNSAPTATAPPGTPPAANYNFLNIGLTQVGAYDGSQNFYGTSDQTGNVWEFCDTITPEIGSPGVSGRVMRGGGAGNSVSSMTSDGWFGISIQESWASFHYGFRIAAALEGGNGNQPPTVNAGTDITSTSFLVPLSGAASDDQLPDPPAGLTITWEKLSGPGSVVFANEGSLSTTATFSQRGSYLLRLSAFDGEFTSIDTVAVTILISFEQHVMPIYSTPAPDGLSCNTCHSIESPSFGNLKLNQSADLVWNELRNETPEGPADATFGSRAKPGEPVNSLILQKPQGLMSHGGGNRNLSQSQIDAITLWINQGALNN